MHRFFCCASRIEPKADSDEFFNKNFEHDPKQMNNALDIGYGNATESALDEFNRQKADVERKLSQLRAQEQKIMEMFVALNRENNWVREPSPIRSVSVEVKTTNHAGSAIMQLPNKLATSTPLRASQPPPPPTVMMMMDACGDAAHNRTLQMASVNGNMTAQMTPADEGEMARCWREARRLAVYCRKDNANAAALMRILDNIAKGRMPTEVDLHLSNFDQLDSDEELANEEEGDDDCFESETSRDVAPSTSLDAFLAELRALGEDTLAKSELVHQNLIMCVGAGLLKPKQQQQQQQPTNVANQPSIINAIGANSAANSSGYSGGGVGAQGDRVSASSASLTCVTSATGSARRSATSTMMK